MYTWNGTSSGAQVEVKSTRPNVFEADVSMSVNGEAASLPKQALSDGTVRVVLTSAQVDTLINDPTAFLSIGTAHTKIPLAPQEDWGWRYRVAQAGPPLSSTYQDDGAPEMTLDGANFRNSAITRFEGDQVFTDETVLIK